MNSAEKKFLQSLVKYKPVVAKIGTQKSHSFAINYLEFLEVRMPNNLIIGYECRLSENINRFPDFLLLKNGNKAIVEIKNSDSISLISREINSLPDFNIPYVFVLINGGRQKLIPKLKKNLRNVFVLDFGKNISKEIMGFL